LGHSSRLCPALRTTPRVQAARQASQEATRVVARRYGLNPKTVVTWRERMITADAPMRPGARRSSVLMEDEKRGAVAFRRRTLLPLDDLLG
jgi:hypothetical protein